MSNPVALQTNMIKPRRLLVKNISPTTRQDQIIGLPLIYLICLLSKYLLIQHEKAIEEVNQYLMQLYRYFTLNVCNMFLLRYKKNN